MPIRRSALCLVLIAGAALLAGCGAEVSTGGPTVGGEDAAATIKKQYPTKSGGPTMAEISCDEADAEVDATFECEGTNDSDVAVDILATVNQIDEDSDEFRFSWSITKLTAPGTLFGDLAAETLAQTRAVDTVDCPDEIVVEQGTVVDCVGTMDNGEKREVKLTLTDESGNFDIDLLGPTEG